MKRTAFQLLAFSSLLVALSLHAATRPRYGGTVRVSMHDSISDLDPSVQDAGSSNDAKLRITRLLFDTLVVESPSGTILPSLARAWTVDSSFRSWQFIVRSDVRFHDGSRLTPDSVVASLAGRVPGCNLRAAAESVLVQCDAPRPGLAAELAMPRNAIVRHAPGGTLQGSGPFLVAQWRPEQPIILTAVEDYWAGRPYLDAIHVLTGQSYRDQDLAFQLDKTDVIELPPGQAARNDRASTSSPAELLALVFSRSAVNVADERVRTLLSLAIDRTSITNVLLQRQGESAAGLLPNWVSGYEAAFATARDAAALQQIRSEVRRPITLTMSYAAADPLLRVVAERISLNLRDSGLNVQLAPDARNADVMLTGVDVASADPAAALAHEASELGLPLPAIDDNSLEAAFKAERALIAGHWVVPVVFVERVYAVSPRLRNWLLRANGMWDADNVWLSPETK
jgi:peptide/nickel transport system substrate-binding protein